MRGHGYGALDGPRSKWPNVNQLMRDKKIAILALQETHLTKEYIKSLHELYGRRIKIYHTGNPDQPNAHGVAVVLN